jgi:hypothetical protein
VWNTSGELDSTSSTSSDSPTVSDAVSVVSSSAKDLASCLLGHVRVQKCVQYQNIDIKINEFSLRWNL